MLATVLLFLASCIRIESDDSEPFNPEKKHLYPTFIPEYEVRKDLHTNETVSRGRLHLINYSQKNGRFPRTDEEQRKKMVSFTDFQRHLQCASPEAELDGTRGGWSLLQMAPPTKQSLEQICAWTESKCFPWVTCRKWVESYKAGSYQKHKASDYFDGVWGVFRGPVMLRVINNELYYDWPWGMERFVVNDEMYAERLSNHYALIEIVLRLVKHIGDSVFFFGGERAFLQWNVPFPTFSFAPSLSYADFPFPWFESYEQEMVLYEKAESKNDFSESFYNQSSTPWDKRIPKAAFFSSFTSFRQVVYDSAARRPDLFDASFSASYINAWNPLSDERVYDPQNKKLVLATAIQTDERNAPADEKVERKDPSGFIETIMKFGDAKKYTPHHYKYIIVPTGTSDKSSSGRLAGLLAHSGAVILLQKSEFAYHFSARLQPWVHYVPLSHSMADVIDKVRFNTTESGYIIVFSSFLQLFQVEWLKNNDHLARRIVRNAQNFALSYLRLEDYLCYAAGSLRLLHDLEKTTDVLEPFNVTKIPKTFL